jgi:hypothetical protein
VTWRRILSARARTGPDERGWERPKQDFLYSGKSLRRIADGNGVALTMLRHRINAFGWVRVIPGPKWKRPNPDLPAANGEDLRRRCIVARLFKMLDGGDALSATPPP